MANINLVEASIEDLEDALAAGHITSVELVARYLRRISKYDCRGLALNAIPVLNPLVFEDAAQSDDRRAAGLPTGTLEGIPYTIKDSFKAKGMAAAAGSPAFKDLISSQDSFMAEVLRGAGCILLGRTNMPSMACGGMQRGIWGRAENPYNPDYLAAAFASGSSNGSAVSTAVSLAAFGLGAETVSSGRSPASNNALIAYTPSRGFLSVRGNWPLYPTCDVVVPHTRTIRDLLCLLDVIAVNDPCKEGDFWREQPFITLPSPWPDKPSGTFKEISSSKSLTGLRIAVPQMFIGGPAPSGARAVETNPAVLELWRQTRQDLESLGAEIVLTPDFPALTAYENSDLVSDDCPRLPPGWNAAERGSLIAHAWNDFLKTIGDAECPDLFAVDTSNIYPDWLRTEPELQFFEKSNSIQYQSLKEQLKRGDGVHPAPSLFETPGLKEAVTALEGMRKYLFEDWLSHLGCDCAVFPSAGDVGPATADSSITAARLAWRNGTYYSNGNRAIRHLGIPTVSVPMGIMHDKHVPVNLTFAGRAYDDVRLLRWAHAFEAYTHHRIPPQNTPPLESDRIQIPTAETTAVRASRPELIINRYSTVPQDGVSQSVVVQGTVEVPLPVEAAPVLEATVDGVPIALDYINLDTAPEVREAKAVFSFTMEFVTQLPILRQGLERTWAPVARDKTMTVILARTANGGRPTGWLGLV